VNIIDSVAIVQTQYRVDGALSFTTMVGPYNWSMDTTIYVDGPHLLNVTVTDVNGHVGGQEIVVHIDNSAPVVTMISPKEGSTLKRAVEVTISVLDRYPISWVNLTLNGAQISSLKSPPYTYQLDTTTFIDGRYVLEALALDDHGRSSGVGVNVTIGNHPPVIAIISPGAGSLIEGNVTVNVSVDSVRPIVYSVLLINGLEVANSSEVPIVFTFNSADYPNGPTSINVTVVDDLGLIGYNEVLVTFDNAPPKPDYSDWIATTVAGAAFITAGIVGAVALVLRQRRLKMHGRLGKW
jgi:chitinase